MSRSHLLSKAAPRKAHPAIEALWKEQVQADEKGQLLASWSTLAKTKPRVNPWLASGVFDAQKRDGVVIEKKWRHGKLEQAHVDRQRTAAAAGRICAQAKVQLHFLLDDFKKIVADRPGALKLLEAQGATAIMNSAVVRTLSAGLEMAAQSHVASLKERREIGTSILNYKERELLKTTPASL